MPRTSATLIAQTDIDGALVGGASLKAEEFATLSAIAAADRCRNPGLSSRTLSGGHV